MLWDVRKNQKINYIPHKKKYELWISRLTQNEV